MCWRIAIHAASLLLAVATTVSGQDSKVFWAKALSVCPADGKSFGWFLGGVEQQEENLVGIFGYSQPLGRDKSPAPLMLQGTESSNGAFWPEVTLEVKDTVSGKWERVQGNPNQGEAKKITIAPGEMRFYLLVNFDPFKAILDRYEEGQVTFDGGAKISFPLHYLRQEKSTAMMRPEQH